MGVIVGLLNSDSKEGHLKCMDMMIIAHLAHCRAFITELKVFVVTQLGNVPYILLIKKPIINLSGGIKDPVHKVHSLLRLDATKK